MHRINSSRRLNTGITTETDKACCGAEGDVEVDAALTGTRSPTIPP